jgi:hypothetical protein
MLDGLTNSDDVLVLKLQEEIPFNECNQAIIQQHDHSLSSHFRPNATNANLKNKTKNKVF